MTTDASEFITDLDAGIFAQKLGKSISNCAAAAIDQDREATINIKLTFKRIGESQIGVKHKLDYSYPTTRGNKKEDETTSTAMYIHTTGAVTLWPQQPFDHGEQGHLLTAEHDKHPRKSAKQ